jgi:hypothetical protein
MRGLHERRLAQFIGLGLLAGGYRLRKKKQIELPQALFAANEVVLYPIPATSFKSPFSETEEFPGL